MTQQDDITQRVLTDDEIREVIFNAIGFGFDPGELQSVNADDLMTVAHGLLSKVSAPIADSTLPLEQALHELIDKIVPGLDTGDLVHDAGRASAMLSGIMASAPVAGEAVAVDVYVYRQDNRYLATALLPIDTPLRPGLNTLYAAPQASECECSRKSKAVSDSEAQL